MQEIHISMEEVKNYYAGRKGSPREVQEKSKGSPREVHNPAKFQHYLLLSLLLQNNPLGSLTPKVIQERKKMNKCFSKTFITIH